MPEETAALHRSPNTGPHGLSTLREWRGPALGVFDGEAGAIADREFGVAKAVTWIAQISEKIGLGLAKHVGSIHDYDSALSQARSNETKDIQQVRRNS